jgi:hypothetical protein
MTFKNLLNFVNLSFGVTMSRVACCGKQGTRSFCATAGSKDSRCLTLTHVWFWLYCVENVTCDDAAAATGSLDTGRPLDQPCRLREGLAANIGIHC